MIWGIRSNLTANLGRKKGEYEDRWLFCITFLTNRKSSSPPPHSPHKSQICEKKYTNYITSANLYRIVISFSLSPQVFVFGGGMICTNHSQLWMLCILRFYIFLYCLRCSTSTNKKKITKPKPEIFLSHLCSLSKVEIFTIMCDWVCTLNNNMNF